MTDNPLTEPQIHRAIRALDAGEWPDGATLRTALLMALAWHAAQAEIAALRAHGTPMAQPAPDLTTIRQANAQRRVRQEAATAGPWLAWHNPDPDKYSDPQIWQWQVDQDERVISGGYRIIKGAWNEADATFIAAARTDDAPAVIDQLCDALEGKGVYGAQG